MLVRNLCLLRFVVGLLQSILSSFLSSADTLTIKSLDGLRGLAVLLVLLSHMSIAQIHLLPVLDFSGLGKAGVYLFFSLSAFLLTWQALEAGAANLKDPKYWFGYLLRRVLRIYPLYALALTVSFVLTRYAPGYSPSIGSAEELLRHLLLLQGNSIYWAIPVEFLYYLLLPLVVFVLFVSARAHPFAPTAIVIALISACHQIWPAHETPPNSISLGYYLTIFFLGSLTANWCTLQRVKSFKDQYHVLAITGYLALIIATLTIPSLWRALINSEATNQAFHRDFLLYGIIWSVCILAAMRASTIFTALFESTALRLLGRISFSIYLWHYLIIFFVARQTPIHAGLQFLLVILVTLPLSWLSYQFIERPFISWGHRRTNPWQEAMRSQ